MTYDWETDPRYVVRRVNSPFTWQNTVYFIGWCIGGAWK